MTIDRQLDALKQVPVPTARDAAKARALAAAMAAYASAPVAKPERAGPKRGPRPFVLQHGYKIAAGLAAFAVIGPMVALWQVPRQRVAERPTETKMKAAAPVADEVRAAPPVTLAPPPAPSVAQDTMVAAKLPAAPVQPVPPAGRTAAAPPPAAVASPPAASPSASMADTQQRLDTARGTRSRKAGTGGPLAVLTAALDAGRLPNTAAIDSVALVNAFDMPSLRVLGRFLMRVPTPWSSQSLEVTWAPGGPASNGRGALEVGPPLLRRPSFNQDAVTNIQDLPMAPDDVRFAIAVARFADLLRGTAENATAFGYRETIALADGAKGADANGQRAAFIILMRKAEAIAAHQP